MKVLIGVDPHKATVAVAAVNEVAGELVEGANFPQNRVGLQALERWAKRFGERRWAVENAGGLCRYLAQRLAAAGESVVDVLSKLSARVRMLSSFAGNARKNDELDALATALWPLGETSAWQRSIPGPNRRCCAYFPKVAKTWWPSVPERSTAGPGHPSRRPCPIS